MKLLRAETEATAVDKKAPTLIEIIQKVFFFNDEDEFANGNGQIGKIKQEKKRKKTKIRKIEKSKQIMSTSRFHGNKLIQVRAPLMTQFVTSLKFNITV